MTCDRENIIGYRADDSYFTFAQDFVSGVIPLSKLSEAMHLGRLGERIVFKSREEFGNTFMVSDVSRLSRNGYQPVCGSY
ncbi:MAG: DUF3990 domain-containing protein [Eubacteriales bacterium]|nr:DUF3990 domain-containing protein [Eubacteriales bacterium]